VATRSAGLLVFRRRPGGTEVFLVHPGGPLWASRDVGAWSIPKGEPAQGEDPLAAARREFREETGLAVTGQAIPLGPVRQAGGKTVLAWAVEGDLDPAELASNHFSMEWPPRSGRLASFPEVDRGGWFAFPEARSKILKGQVGLIDRLEAWLAERAAQAGRTPPDSIER
jgi:predicted NUDIX family NTP pyrophosphohydrolase